MPRSVAMAAHSASSSRRHWWCWQAVQASTSDRTPLGVAHGEELRDHAAHRRADHVGRTDAGRIEHGHRVVGHLVEGVAAEGLVAAPDAAVVEGDRAHRRGEGEALEHPAVLVRAEPLDHQQRLAPGQAAHVEVEPSAVGRAGGRHVADATNGPGRPQQSERPSRAGRGEANQSSSNDCTAPRAASASSDAANALARVRVGSARPTSTRRASTDPATGDGHRQHGHAQLDGREQQLRGHAPHPGRAEVDGVTAPDDGDLACSQGAGHLRRVAQQPPEPVEAGRPRLDVGHTGEPDRPAGMVAEGEQRGHRHDRREPPVGDEQHRPRARQRLAIDRRRPPLAGDPRRRRPHILVEPPRVDGVGAPDAPTDRTDQAATR